MKSSFSEKFIAYLALVSGLTISIVAEYYSILGLTTIFSAAIIPVIIMGIVLGIGKITATLWLKQNWNIAPWSLRIYLSTAILVLMLITSMGIFGLLSKAHSDQTLAISDVQSKLVIYDEKIKTAKENIEADRRQLKQMDEAVDQVMARSTTEQGAEKSNTIRKAQARDRSALAKNIEANQKLIATLNEEASPIRAEIRNVEAEVGPIKYIAAFVYGETEQSILEKAVTWVIIILIIVFDPLAVILLLASQISFQHIREKAKEKQLPDIVPSEKVQTHTTDEVITPSATELSPTVDEKSLDEFDISKHPYLKNGFGKLHHPPGVDPVGPQIYKPEQEIISTIEENIVPDEIDASQGKSEENFIEPNIKERLLNERKRKVSLYVRLAREGRIDLSQVPAEFLAEVKTRV